MFLRRGYRPGPSLPAAVRTLVRGLRLRTLFFAERSVVPAPGSLDAASLLGRYRRRAGARPWRRARRRSPRRAGRHHYYAKTGTATRARDDGVVMRRIVTTSHP